MEDQNTILNKIKFDPDHLTYLLGENHKYNKNTEPNNQSVIPVCRIHIENCQKCSNLDKNESKSSQYIPFSLKAWTCSENQHEDDYIFIKPALYERSFLDYFNDVLNFLINNQKREVKEVREKQKELNLLIKGIFELIRQLHVQNISLMNFSFNNIRVYSKNDVLKPKLVNIIDAKIIFDGAGFNADLNKTGQLLLSLFIKKANFYKELDKKETYEKKLVFINNELKHIKCIEPYKLKLFGHMVLCLIELRTSNKMTVKEFKRHPFFWDEKEIEDFLRIINSRLDTNDKEKTSKKYHDRINQLNDNVNYDGWKLKIDQSIQHFVSDVKGKNVLACNDLIKFIRNKIAHRDDDTDNEDNCDQSSSITACVSTSTGKKCKDSKTLRNFFDKNGGPLYYFLETFVNLLYELFIYFRGMSKHKKIGYFYPACFLEDISSFPMQGSKPTAHPHVNPGSKNMSLKNVRTKEDSMRNPHKKQCSDHSSNIRN